MKKLMIVAAVAAMVGAAEAYTAAYNYSASVKTTTGKKGKAINTSYSVKLGKDAAGKFWYEQFSNAYVAPGVASVGQFAITADNKYGTYTLNNVVYSNVTFTAEAGGWLVGKLNGNFNAMPQADKEQFAADFGFNPANGTTAYNVKSAGVWCQTFSYVHTDGAQCYRVATSKSYKGFMTVVNDCCAAATANLWDSEGNALNDANGAQLTVTKVMLNRFGAQAIAKANKVEWMGTIGTAANYGQADVFALAGQGTWAKLGKDDQNNDADIFGVSAVSGNIVGAIAGTECEYCCQPNTAATFFQCNGTFVDPTGALANNPTAAFGTFTFKFNKKESANIK